MVVAMVLMVPMAFVVGPSTIVVVVVGMLPGSAGKGRPAPFAAAPGIAATLPVPVAIGPNVTRGWDGGPYFIT